MVYRFPLAAMRGSMRFAIPRCALACAILIGCPQEFSVWIEPNSTRDTLVIGVSGQRGGSRAVPFTSLVVGRCQSAHVDGEVWLIERRADAPYPSRITYGVTPPGFLTLKGPTPLIAGCYEVAVGAVGTLFDVLEDGQVIEQKAER